MRGHARASLYSLEFSRDGTVLVSGCADNSESMGCQKNTIDAGPEPEAFNNNVNGNETNSDGALSTQQQQQPQQQQQSKRNH